ncbi:membrane protein ORF102 [Anguillid herpesvirus 1]|nr:membrane protein ORF102 [Anguillid herpesvirus 1]UTN00357.1 membrane protein ORF102 [Anguillid herpesvirus 1]
MSPSVLWFLFLFATTAAIRAETTNCAALIRNRDGGWVELVTRAVEELKSLNLASQTAQTATEIAAEGLTRALNEGDTAFGRALLTLVLDRTGFCLEEEGGSGEDDEGEDDDEDGVASGNYSAEEESLLAQTTQPTLEEAVLVLKEAVFMLKPVSIIRSTIGEAVGFVVVGVVIIVILGSIVGGLLYHGRRSRKYDLMQNTA